MGTLQPYELSNLSQANCWLLFMQRALGHQEEINPNLVVIGKEIVKKCGGVPLAAKTLGVFPKDTEMEKENLISLWMAHGFLLSKGNLELEYVGNEVWNELYLRSFFQEIEVKSGNTYFKMHDLIHDLATSLFSASTSSSNIRQVSVKYYPYMMSIGLAEIVSPYSPPLLQNFVLLWVLNLSYIELELEQLPSSIGDLVHLRYLNLSSNLRIRSLPKQLCKLQNLQTLDLHDCWSLSCLPKQTSKLGSLRNLLLDGCPLTCMPPRIGSLTCLKTLSYFVVGRKKGCQLGELRNLDLHGTISITHLERVKKDTEAKEANLSAKENLHSLRMSWYKYGPYCLHETDVLEALKPHPNLTSLTIIDFRGFRLPDWMNHSVLKRVVSIRIEGCENCSCLPPFGDLPCLESLVLANGSGEVEYVEEDDVSTRRWFPSLRKLSIWDFRNLKGLLKKGGEEQFPVLEEMDTDNCPMFVIPTLSSVRKLVIFGEADATSLNSISNLCALTYLHISSIIKATSLPEEMLKSLANLKYLKISGLCNLKELPSSLASLNALKSLEIESCYELESLPEEGVKGLTSLTELSIFYCEMLKCLPEGLQHLTALTSLSISRSPTLEKRCEKGIGEDWHKIAHIPYLKLYE
uniref:NBS-LRR resistance protein n=1 Tax=Solanum tuberosum TaxID=4113 RepID=M1ACF7_SOLTU